MKIKILFSIACIAAAVCACDILPAEEFIEDTGAAAFVASFEVPGGIPAYWNAEDKLMVVDSEGKLHKFALDYGAGSVSGEFSGEITPKSQISYVIYSPDANDVTYDAGSRAFTMNISNLYSATQANALVASNNAAIGTLRGSEVDLQSVCGFIRFTLEGNGKTLDQGGVTYELTDLKSITFTSNEGKFFAGEISASWPDGSVTPEFTEVRNGHSSVTFNTRVIETEDGETLYQAGDYYIPVAPQNYEDVSIYVEDGKGRRATAVRSRAIDVQRAVTSNLNTVNWPTVVVYVTYNASTAAESQAHTVVNAFGTSYRSVDRYSLTTGEKVEGTSQEKTEINFTEDDVTYTLWATGGYGRNTIGSGIFTDIVFNAYNADWETDGDHWKVGSTNGYAWVRFPGRPDGVLSKMEVEVISNCLGPFSVATAVDPETGAPIDPIYEESSTQRSPFRSYTIGIPEEEPETPYYLVMGDGYHYRLRSWKLYYKVYE